MNHRNKTRRFSMRARLCLVPAGLAALAVAGCEDYFFRRDALTLGVGDAIEVNKATQTIDRWPAAAREDRWYSDGERARIAIERYRKREVPDPLKDAGPRPGTTSAF